MSFRDIFTEVSQAEDFKNDLKDRDQKRKEKLKENMEKLAADCKTFNVENVMIKNPNAVRITSDKELHEYKKRSFSNYYSDSCLFKYKEISESSANTAKRAKNDSDEKNNSIPHKKS